MRPDSSSWQEQSIVILFICQRFSLLYFPMRMKAIFGDIQSYSVLSFLSTKPPLNSKRRTRVGNLQHVSHLESLR